MDGLRGIYDRKGSVAQENFFRVKNLQKILRCKITESES
jgi:hypothetical protein